MKAKNYIGTGKPECQKGGKEEEGGGGGEGRRGEKELEWENGKIRKCDSMAKCTCSNISGYHSQAARSLVGSHCETRETATKQQPTNGGNTKQRTRRKHNKTPKHHLTVP